ncbi:MAG TPA: DUF1269 domain-containing protein [Pyrinomonadaceae bacterium]|nr:DUF1269 domain-containing protein [Pyrinomonadaceae bacterium]
MSNENNKLIALVFDDPYKADEARAALNRMTGEGLLEIDETALIVKKADGKVRVSQDINVVEKDQHLGHVAGLITAAVTGTMPFILGGTIAGKLIGKLHDDGITNKFLKSLEKELKPNTSVLVVYARSDAERRQAVMKRLAIFDPKLLESDVSPELEQTLQKEMQAVAQKAAAAK